MAIERWRAEWAISPWRALSALEDMERRMDELFGTRALRRFPLLEREWVPAVEKYEKEDRYVIKAELPGMKQEDVDISLTDDTLTIKGVKGHIDSYCLSLSGIPRYKSSSRFFWTCSMVSVSVSYLGRQ